MKSQFKPALAYNALTPLYDKLNNLLGFGNKLTLKIVKIADLKKNEKVLDVGTGTGTFIFEAVKQHPDIEITGLDPDQKILRIAEYKLRHNKKNITLIQGYAQELPFQDGSFDVIVSSLVFHHLPTPVKKQALKEIHRVLKNDGRFLLADFGKPQSLAEAVLLNFGSIFDGRENTKVNLEGKLPGFLEQSGFKVKEIFPSYRGIHYLYATK